MAGDARCASSMLDQHRVAEVVRGGVLRCMRTCHEQISLKMHVAMLVKKFRIKPCSLRMAHSCVWRLQRRPGASCGGGRVHMTSLVGERLAMLIEQLERTCVGTSAAVAWWLYGSLVVGVESTAR
jgi:hypothetical protein